MKTNIFYIFLFACFISNAQLDRSIKPVSGPAPEIKFGKPNEFKLKNGLKVLVVEDHKFPTVSVSLDIKNGSIYDGDKVGVSGLLSSVIGNGTTSVSKDDFNEKVEFVGASIGYGASNAYGAFLSKYTNELFSLFADGALNPLLTEEEFINQKERTIESLKNNEKDSGTIASRVSGVLAYGADSAYGEYVTVEKLEKITLQDVKDYYKKYFRPNNAYLIFNGDITVKEAKALTKRYFNEWEKSETLTKETPTIKENPTKTEIAFVNDPNAVQSIIELSNTVELKRTDEDYFAVLIANQILGGGMSSYLFKSLRETHGYTYGAYSSVSPSKHLTSRFFAKTSVRNEVTDSSVVALVKEIKRIRTEDISKEDLEIAKSKYLSNFIFSLESPATVASYEISKKENNLPKNYFKTFLENIDAVTIEDVKAAANKHFKLDNARILVVGKGSEVADNLEKTGIPVKYYDNYGNEIEKPEFSKDIPEGMTGLKVVNNYIEKIGGLQTIKDVKSLEFNAKAEIQEGVNLVLNTIKTNQKQYLIDMSLMGQSMMKTALNNDKGYISVQGMKEELGNEEIEAMQIEANVFPVLSLLDSELKIEKIVKMNNEFCYKVNVTEDMNMYFSDTTFLKVAQEIVYEDGNEITIFKDYKPISNILLPHTVEMDMAGQKLELKVEDYTLNKDYDSKIFE